MRNFTKNNVLALVSCAALLFSACGDDSKNAGGSVEDQEIIAISDKTVTGVSQKGPFVNGSSVTVQELNGETLAQTGLGFEGKIKNDMGEFSVKVNKLESQYALLKANGFYRNEVTGEKSKSQVTLYALTDLSKRDEVNVNLLTHLSYERSLYLATEEESVSVTDAKKQAETEVLKSFEIEGDFDDAEDLNIFGESDQSAALLAVSVLMQGNLSEGDFSERLANYAADIESDGVWNDTKTATQIADWAITQSMSGGLALIRNNIAGWKLSTGVPAFEKYVDNFWWRNYGLGTCDKEREGEVKKNQNAASVYADKYFICRSNLWYVATALEYDTYEWEDGKDGDVKNGDVVKENCYVFEDSSWRAGDKKDCSLKLRGCTKLRQDTVGLGEDKVWYICDAQAWRNATDIEKDTFGWKDSTDGAIKKGNVTVSIYVFDKTKWRATSDVEAKLGGCVSAIADSVGKVGTTYYICSSNKWIEASAIEYDTYRWATGKDGDSKVGSVNAKNCYVYENSVWRSGNANDCSLELRGCTKIRQDTVGQGSDKVWYICDAQAWRNATIYEKDTFGWKDSADGAIKKGNVTDSIYVFDKTKWRATSDVEAKLGGCVSAIADSVGKVGSTYYICRSNKWVEASTIEYDTYRWTAGKDGDSKVGSVNAKNCYVYENSVWRSGNANDCSLELRGCTKIRQDTVGKGSNKVWYICDAQAWRNATDIEKDTATWGAGKNDGEIRKGQINKDTYYIYDADKILWRKATSVEYNTYQVECTKDGKMFNGKVDSTAKFVCDDEIFRKAGDLEVRSDSACTSYNLGVYYVLPNQYSYYKCTEEGWIFTLEKLNQGTMTDSRDGREYKTIGIKTQMWMAENLNYADSVSYPSMLGKNWCLGSLDSCAVYGRYYTWSAAIDSIYWSKLGKTCGYIEKDDYEHVYLETIIRYDGCGLPKKVQGICPDKWHIPSVDEWEVLFSAVNGDSYALFEKNRYGRKSSDIYGFSLRFNQNYSYPPNLSSEGAYVWTSSEYDDRESYYAHISSYVRPQSFKKATGLIVRCIKDEEE